MIFSILLTAMFFFMTLYTLVFFGSSHIGRALVLGYLVATVIVWFPQISTEFANRLGIGRGVDLVLMIVVVVLINAMLLLARHLHLLHTRLTKLARHIAIAESHGRSLPEIDEGGPLRAGTPASSSKASDQCPPA